MSATRILWGQIVTVCLIVLVALWGATQWTAHALGYQPQLQPVWFMLGSIPIYPPPAFFWWWFSFDAYAPEIFLRGATIAASGGLLSVAVAIGMSVWRAREQKNALTFGSARWATPQEVAAGGLLGEAGVVLGPAGRILSAPRRSRTCVVFRPDTVGQGRRTGGADAADLAWQLHRP